MDKLKDKCNRQLQLVGNIKRKLTTTRSISSSAVLERSCDDQDLDHLLEDTDQVDTDIRNIVLFHSSYRKITEIIFISTIISINTFNYRIQNIN